jgi:hypothetical protein
MKSSCLATGLFMLGLLVLSALPWHWLDGDRIISRFECHWQYGPAMCRDWHRR